MKRTITIITVSALLSISGAGLAHAQSFGEGFSRGFNQTYPWGLANRGLHNQEEQLKIERQRLEMERQRLKLMREQLEELRRLRYR